MVKSVLLPWSFQPFLEQEFLHQVVPKLLGVASYLKQDYHIEIESLYELVR